MPVATNPSFGLGFKKDLNFFKLALAADMRNLDVDTNFVNKTHVGANLGMPLIDLYVGLNQMRATYGMAFDIWLIKISLLSYGEELGVKFGQNPSRRYLFQLDFQLPI